jgi:hypothetical protein
MSIRNQDESGMPTPAADRPRRAIRRDDFPVTYPRTNQHGSAPSLIQGYPRVPVDGVGSAPSLIQGYPRVPVDGDSVIPRDVVPRRASARLASSASWFPRTNRGMVPASAASRSPVESGAVGLR